VKNIAAASCALLACISTALVISQAHAQDASARRAPRIFFEPAVPAVMPHNDSRGTYGLRLRLEYFETVTGNLELRRHQYFVDDNLKTQYPRTSVAWSVRWYF
jgi:hypothetical protein